MTTWHPNSERERTDATVSQCEGDLRLAHERARSAGETLRRALRGVEEAEEAFRLATRRLGRAGLHDGVRRPLVFAGPFGARMNQGQRAGGDGR